MLKVRLGGWDRMTGLLRCCRRKGVRPEFPDYRDDVVRLLVATEMLTDKDESAPA